MTTRFIFEEAKDVPTIDVAGVNVHFDEFGPRDGLPIVLIHGLGIPATLWHRQVPAFSTHHRVIVLDNRGSGRSDQPDEGYSVARMAEDVVELLHHLDVDRAVVLGLSLGGLIAQQLALTYPERIIGLILASTHAGGPKYLEATGDLWRERLNVADRTLREIYLDALEWGATDDFMANNPEEVEHFVRARLELPQSPAGFQGQFMAGAAFDSREQLPAISAPTVVIHGRHDEIVPLSFGEFIADRIPEAQLHVIEDAGHLPFVERPDTFNEIVLQFLADVTGKGDAHNDR